MTSQYLFAAAAALGAVSAPAVAQNYQQPYQPYQQAYPQAYPGYPQPGYAQPGYAQPGYAQPGYAQPGYGYPGQGYPAQGGVISQLIDQLLGNRYTVTDRSAVSQCASAALAQAEVRYRGQGQYGGQGYAQGYAGQYQGQGYYPGQGYNQGYSQAMRVTAITDVQRRSGILRVKGLIATGQGYGNGYGYSQGGYGQSGYGVQGYADPRYAAAADLTFRCNVDYRGAVTNVRLTRNTTTPAYRRY